ncbi:MAG: hypothetical protein HY720_14010 [Planctomycetes bacterium]|nr:hypothetical protein [Planctomycetota bacterium]
MNTHRISRALEILCLSAALAGTGCQTASRTPSTVSSAEREEEAKVVRAEVQYLPAAETAPPVRSPGRGKGGKVVHTDVELLSPADANLHLIWYRVEGQEPAYGFVNFYPEAVTVQGTLELEIEYSVASGDFSAESVTLVWRWPCNLTIPQGRGFNLPEQGSHEFNMKGVRTTTLEAMLGTATSGGPGPWELLDKYREGAAGYTFKKVEVRFERIARGGAAARKEVQAIGRGRSL